MYIATSSARIYNSASRGGQKTLEYKLILEDEVKKERKGKERKRKKKGKIEDRTSVLP